MKSFIVLVGLVGLMPAMADEPPRVERTASPKGLHVCWARTDDGNLTWAEFAPGTTCPFDRPTVDPDQESAGTEENDNG